MTGSSFVDLFVIFGHLLLIDLFVIFDHLLLIGLFVIFGHLLLIEANSQTSQAALMHQLTKASLV